MITQRVFSYGTLQYENVQLSKFGRLLKGTKDSLPEFNLSVLEITNPEVVAISGHKNHPVVVYTGDRAHKVEGMVFELTQTELEKADSYESADYKRIHVKLNSGLFAWVYVQR
jgi:gamma-glutamylcyclotransferase (GGCT)/AIG2-like uncharacterized protein YtfP